MTPNNILDLGVGQRRRRLVEDEHARVERQRAGDGHHRSLHGREGRRRGRAAGCAGRAGRAAAAASRRIALPVHDAARRPCALGECDVLGDGDRLDDRQLLVQGDHRARFAAFTSEKSARSPPTRTSPSSWPCTPVTTLISVGLPAPFSPSRACTSPARTSRSTPPRACTPSKCFVTPAHVHAGVPPSRRSSWSSRVLCERIAPDDDLRVRA